ncbi:type IX secretion system membrane protein, PorP/SprF family [Chitinophaga sp. YR627]|uniref:PorP/SprF family type IX secretion system membrane protein n=1 Tax=Chitinophaga sp. YR627 TaxID=1881041 RepID=UPI0008F41765|nr:type IX secretion system membrane protein PorP/SprF [Chitinophaga sp. YR627]SFN02998.1 type IX secretion system membrane protein, PorP/SprF family [Chitinophaga sp. YR627]
MKQVLAVITCLILGLADVRAQQDAMYSQYMFNMMGVNPAYAGSRGVLSATALYRRQWVGIDGAPETSTFAFDMATRDNKVGLGIQAFNDKIGIMRTTGFYATYAYRIRFENEGSLAIGLQGGLSNFKADLTKVDLIDEDDQAFVQNINVLLPCFGAGIYYNTDRFYAGFSIPNLVKSYLRKDAVYYRADVVAKKYMHFFFIAGYVFDLNEDLKLKPSTLVKAVRGAPVQVDINANLWIRDVISVGASYRTGDAICGLAEVQINDQFRLGYAYDHTVSKLVKYNQGTHEIMLRYEFGWEKGRVLSPRYF